MNWSFEINNITKTSRGVTVDVQFTNDDESYEKSMHLERQNATRARLEQLVRNEVKAYERQDQIENDVSAGAFTLTPEEEVVDPAPTQDELDEQEYYKDLALLRNAQELVDLGVLVGDETALVNLRNKVKNEFKIDYIA